MGGKIRVGQAEQTRPKLWPSWVCHDVGTRAGSFYSQSIIVTINFTVRKSRTILCSTVSMCTAAAVRPLFESRPRIQTSNDQKKKGKRESTKQDLNWHIGPSAFRRNSVSTPGGGTTVEQLRTIPLGQPSLGTR